MTLELTPRSEFPPPESISLPAIRKAVIEWRKARLASRQASAEAVALEQARPAAIARDREALADALQANKADPGQSNLEAHEARLEAAERFSQARQVVEQRAFDALSQTVSEKLPEWSAAADKQVSEARAELTQALDEFLAPRLAALTEALAVRRFVTGSDSGRYRVPGAQVELPRSSETRVQADDVISALRQLGSEPEQPPAPVYSGSMRVAGVR